MTLRLVTDALVDAEAAVVGAILLDPAVLPAVIASGVTWRHFGDAAIQAVYIAMLKLRREQAPIDPVTVCRCLEDAGQLVAAGGTSGVRELLYVIPSAANVAYYAQLVRDAGLAREGDARGQYEQRQAGQIGDALDRLALPASAYLRMPWAALDAVMGGMAPGGVHFFCARSGQGKTSFLLSLMCRLHAAGHRIYYAGLESQPLTLRIQWAARVCGYDPGQILSGQYLHWLNAETVRERLEAELRLQQTPRYQSVRFAPHADVDQAAMAEICVEAAHFGADILVVDHIDHISADGSPYQASRKTTDTLLKLTQRYQLRSLVASQINREGMSTDAFRNHRAVREEHVKMGDHKLEIAETMWGLYQPLRAEVTNAARDLVAKEKASIATVLEPNTITLNCMKHRLFGQRRGMRVPLRFDRGEVLDATAKVGAIA